MKVLHSGTLDVKYGGPALSTYLSIKGLLTNSVSTEMLMAPIMNSNDLIGSDIKIHYTDPAIFSHFKYIPNLNSTLRKLPTYDIYHIQGIWLYLSHGVASYARNINRPYIITLRGMLYPQALEHSKIIKKFSLACYQKNDLQKASCIQATCIDEMQHYRNLGLTNPVAILPNPIDTSKIINTREKDSNVFRLGYLGRLHPRKRVERLIYAFSDLRDKLKNSELIIIGSDNNNYQQFLENEVKRLKLNNVKFTGFLTGSAKDKALNSLSILCVPSDFENFGNIVTEALVREIPVIASTGTPWHELEEYHCGWWINNDQITINNTILKAYHTQQSELNTMGINGRRLIINKYSVEILGFKMNQLYEWILNHGEKPEFVHL